MLTKKHYHSIENSTIVVHKYYGKGINAVVMESALWQWSFAKSTLAYGVRLAHL